MKEYQYSKVTCNITQEDCLNDMGCYMCSLAPIEVDSYRGDDSHPYATKEG